VSGRTVKQMATLWQAMEVSRRQLLAGLAVGGGYVVYETPGALPDSVPSNASALANATGNQSESLLGTPANDPPTPDVQSDGVHRQDQSWLQLRQGKLERQIHAEIQSYRTLSWDAELARIARYHSWDMAQRDYYAHESPKGKDPGDRYRRFGYNCDSGSSENIVKMYAFTDVEGPEGDTVYYDSADTLAAGVVDEWLHSDAHRENIMMPQWSRHGVGAWWVKNDEYGGVTVYVTQNFC